MGGLMQLVAYGAQDVYLGGHENQHFIGLHHHHAHHHHVHHHHHNPILLIKRVNHQNVPMQYHETCAICLENFEDEVGLLSCNHYYHVNCITEWLETHETCPYCNTVVTPFDNQDAENQSITI